MIEMKPVVTYRNRLLRQGRGVRKARAAILEGLKSAVRFWWSRYLRRHFQRGAQQRYRYAPRTRGYLERKRRAKGHSDPLTFTGRMRAALLTGVRLTGGLTKGVRGRMRGVPYLAIRFRATSNQPDKQAEIKATTNDERAKMARQADQVATERLNQPDPPERIRP